MAFYILLHKWLGEGESARLVGLWYTVLLFLIVISLSQTGIDLRYENI